jgi:glycine/D-amino acid oxidase-like deaminating enzyme
MPLIAIAAGSAHQVQPTPLTLVPSPHKSRYKLQLQPRSLSPPCLAQELGTAELLQQQACFLPCTDDGLPVLGGVPGLEGAYVATGHSCWGILNAPASGLAMAELIVDGACRSVDIRAFDPARFAVKGGRR